MKGKYCKCLNIYTIDKCKKKRCNAPAYWGQGIGSEGNNDNPADIKQPQRLDVNNTESGEETNEPRITTIIRVSR
jgi:hypothetical protein